MATQAATYQRNMESNILFMQTEHAKTLKGLHEEIQSLQKKCSDLTFQLNMQGLGDDTGVTSPKLEELQKQLKGKETEQLEMCQELQKKDKMIKLLETEVKKLKINHQREMRKKMETSDQLRADLEAKSNQVAYLTTELHKLKKLQLENSPKQTAYLDYTHGLMPSPPKEPVSFNIRRGHIRSRKKQEIEEKEREMNPVRVLSGGALRPESPAMELARSFIEKPENDVSTVQENKHPILPPIHHRPSTTDYPGNQAGSRPPVLVQHVPSHPHQKKKVNISSEVQVIAVDQVGPDSKWATHAHESQSTEYN